MKCVKSPTNEVKRVPNARAEELVLKGWSFTNKQAWKESEGTSWTKASTPANPMNPNKVRSREKRDHRPTTY
jgi:hypothetical protein